MKAIVVGGMSGSPIYIEGKLAGAYAYGWLFGKEPVVGVTPISNMLAEIARPIDPAIWKAIGTLVYSWPDAYDKARAADKILRARLDRLGLRFDHVLTEFVGANATHGPLAGPPPADLAEVQLRVGVRGNDRGAVERFTKEIAPLVLTGPPAVTGFAGGRPKVEEITAYWPALIPKSEINPVVEVIDV